MMETTRHIDHDLESMIAAHVLARAPAVSEVLAHCRIDDFDNWIFRTIVEAAQLIVEEGFTPSPVIMRPRLSAEIKREIEIRSDMTVADFLTGLANTATPFQPVAELAKKLSDMAMRRRLDAELEAARERLAAYGKPVTQAISGVLDVANDAALMAAKARGHEAAAEAPDLALRGLEDAMNGKSIPSVTTGLKRLDGVLGGLRAADLVIVAGRPGMGKSLLISNICRAAAQHGHPAILFSLEMTRQQVLHRFMTDIEFDQKAPHQSPIPYSRLRSGKITQAEFDRIYGATQQFKKLPFDIIDLPAMNMHEISAIATRFARGKRMGIIAIDYLQLVKVADRYRGMRALEVGEVTATAKELARKLEWPVIVGCQLNRGVESTENKHPTLANLRESGSIEQDADIAIGLYREACYVSQRQPADKFDPAYSAWKADWMAAKDKLELCVMKNRMGPTPVIGVSIDIEAGAIRDAIEQPELSVVL